MKFHAFCLEGRCDWEVRTDSDAHAHEAALAHGLAKGHRTDVQDTEKPSERKEGR